MEPIILNGMKAIKSKFGVSACKVREWVSQGAPIIVHNTSRALHANGKHLNGLRYSADYSDLKDWLLEYEKPAKTSQDFFAGRS